MHPPRWKRPAAIALGFWDAPYDVHTSLHNANMYIPRSMCVYVHKHTFESSYMIT